MMTWQPIETAPKDGTQFLAFEIFTAFEEPLPRTFIAQWWPGNELNRADWTDSSSMYCTPTHWMPLPAAPEAVGQ